MVSPLGFKLDGNNFKGIKKDLAFGFCVFGSQLDFATGWVVRNVGCNSILEVLKKGAKRGNKKSESNLASRIL